MNYDNQEDSELSSWQKIRRVVRARDYAQIARGVDVAGKDGSDLEQLAVRFGLFRDVGFRVLLRVTILFLLPAVGLLISFLPFSKGANSYIAGLSLLPWLIIPSTWRNPQHFESEFIGKLLNLMDMVNQGNWRDLRFRQSLIRELELTARALESLARSSTSWRDRSTRKAVLACAARVAARYRGLKPSMAMPSESTPDELMTTFAADAVQTLRSDWWSLSGVDSDYSRRWFVRAALTLAALGLLGTGVYLFTLDDSWLARGGAVAVAAIGLSLLDTARIKIPVVGEAHDLLKKVASF